ncbi:MAG: hypothetical protein KatS3mg102_0979 [Planctomycetota bacterium]|nr:MAG: hypothetical protein KatS3mg102_0979 [Planctomycetota bacterium]
MTETAGKSGTQAAPASAPAQRGRPRGKRRRFEGVVLSDKMDKTITVQHTWLARHPKYGKYVRRFTKLKAHDEKNEARVGGRGGDRRDAAAEPDQALPPGPDRASRRQCVKLALGQPGARRHGSDDSDDSGTDAAGCGGQHRC